LVIAFKRRSPVRGASLFLPVTRPSRTSFPNRNLQLLRGDVTFVVARRANNPFLLEYEGVGTGLRIPSPNATKVEDRAVERGPQGDDLLRRERRKVRQGHMYAPERPHAHVREDVEMLILRALEVPTHQ